MTLPDRRASLLGLLLVACGPVAKGALLDGGATAEDAGDAGAGADAGDPRPDAGSCRINAVPLGLTLDDGVADSQVVPVTFRGVEGYLAIDTGSPYTYVLGKAGDPKYVQHYGDVTLGCEMVPVDLITIPAFPFEQFEGKPIFGSVGYNFFTGVPAEIDYPGRRVVRYPGATPDPTGTVAVSGVFTENRVVVEAVLDQQVVHLIYDAGAHDTLWVGVQGDPTDPVVPVGTADGQSVDARRALAQLTLGGMSRSITVMKLPMFPYLQDELTELRADGLLGVTGIGFRRIVFDRAHGRLLLGQPADP